MSRLKGKKAFFAGGVAGVLLLNAVSRKSTAFSDWYVTYIFPLWLNTYARLTSLVPFSVGEIMLVLAVLVTLFGVALLIVNLIRKNKYKGILKRFGIAYAWIALVVCYIMTLNCSILYHTSDFSEKYMKRGTTNRHEDALLVDFSDEAVVKTRTDGYSQEEIALLRDFIVERCNTLAQEIARDDSGRACYDGDLFDAAVDAMKKLGGEYEQLSGFYVTPKYLTCSKFFSQQYIMGYYFPFSLEANINSVMYITNVPSTVCHELAHTKGFINEDDANMIGYLACVQSDDVFLQYCGYLSVLNYVNNDFYNSIHKDKELYQSHIPVSDLVAKDNIFLTKEEWESVEEKAVVKTETVKKASNAFTETVLVMNGVEEGMQQYNKVVELLLAYYDGILY
ncbi:MAG: DUF3810 domain-containing protein [Lachnospiraceae bacterium]|nr:DUF3810 domain-containing protein [Lachnospiraceae bacterium]